MNTMKILMFGWELPPFNSGGLGVACQGLAQALVNRAIPVSFVLPKQVDLRDAPFRVLFAMSGGKHARLHSAYDPLAILNVRQRSSQFLNELFGDVYEYARAVPDIIRQEEFDLIHAHDWLSFPAALEAKKVSGKPLVFHVHATEFDRTGGASVNETVYDIERQGMAQSDAVIAVSNFTKRIIVERYGVSEEKVHVVHNGITLGNAPKRKNARRSLSHLRRGGNKIILFVGRITLQKGPDYFLNVAKRVLQYIPQSVFVIAGSGDMEHAIIAQAAQLGISDKVIFAGFLRGKELTRVYQAADVLVMPSVSEPFGITSLESLANKTPVIISKQSGACEVLTHVLKADFWDIDDMTDKVVSLLRYPPLHHCLQEDGYRDVAKLSWDQAVDKCIAVYQGLMLQNAL